jgi:hypothetical protein
MTDAKPKRRWFRFSLRTLLVLVTLAAVGSWAYWIGWPWWLVSREQSQIVELVSQLKIGISMNEVEAITASGDNQREWCHGGNPGNNLERFGALLVMDDRYRTYCLYAIYSWGFLKGRHDGPVIYKLLQTHLFKLPLGSLSSPDLYLSNVKKYDYLEDLNKHGASGPTLIYSDPSAK